ncbi:hypothetical protein F8M41_016948 [Gigaspora margarita]|uniref:LITAF domain-containing protein n=1 Tax=Gigaspora margarita TaxID=4874 RepID=A0A8H4ANW7_GIGMA|nr:hypothetical protein F8M41_016948 [Gigaspora margarita]
MQQPYNFRSHPQSPYPSNSNIVNPDASSNINPIIDSKINTTINSYINPTMNSNVNTNNSTHIQVIVSSTEVDCACPYCNNSLPPGIRYRPGLTSFLTGVSLCCCYYQMFWLPCVQNRYLDAKNMYRNRLRKQRGIKKPWTPCAVLLVMAIAIVIVIAVLIIFIIVGVIQAKPGSGMNSYSLTD